MKKKSLQETDGAMQQELPLFCGPALYNYRSVVVIVGGSDIYNAFRSTSEYERYDIGSHEQQNIR